MSMKVDFSDRIRTLREGRNMTQSELGRKINVTKAVISSYETGTHQPKHDALVKLTKVFGVSMDYLYGREDAACQDQAAGIEVDLSGLDKEQLQALGLVIRAFKKTGAL